MSDTNTDAAFALKLVRDQVTAKLNERSATQALVTAADAEVDAIISKANTERRDIDEGELALIKERKQAIEPVKADLAKILSDLESLQEREAVLVDHANAKDASQASAKRWAGVAESPEVGAAPAIRVKTEARTYNQGNRFHGVSFFADVASTFLNPNNSEASQRLARHQQEARTQELAGYERRDLATSAFAGLTVPQYLTDLAAPLQRAMAPTVGICNRHPLPDNGMTVNISRITTGTAAAAQASENAAVQETDADDTLLTVNVRTYAGQQDMSRQSIERGTGTDDIIFQDLSNAYWSKVDDAILNADGTSGTHLSIRSTTSVGTVAYTDANPTAAEAYKTLAEAVATVQTAVFMGVSHFVMTPKRWWWLSAGIASSFPMLQVPQVGSVQAGNVGGTEYLATNRNILGVPVIVDGNMVQTIGAGTEDVILAVTDRELHFWDDGVQFVRAEQTAAGNLTVKLVVYGYSAFTAGRYPGAHAIISGTGLIAPVFATA
jgi:hypothetical protein